MIQSPKLGSIYGWDPFVPCGSVCWNWPLLLGPDPKVFFWIGVFPGFGVPNLGALGLCEGFFFPWGGPRFTPLGFIGGTLKPEGREKKSRGVWLPGLLRSGGSTEREKYLGGKKRKIPGSLIKRGCADQGTKS